MVSHSGVFTPCSRNFSFDRILSKASSTPLDSFARVSDAALFQNLLDLAVFAKGSVQRDECKLDIARQLKRRIPHIDIDDVRAE